MQTRRFCNIALLVMLTLGQGSIAQHVMQSKVDALELVFQSEEQRHVQSRRVRATGQADGSIDVTYYKLGLSITTSPSYLRGTVTVKARCTADHLSSITLDLANAMTVDSVTANNRSLPFLRLPTTVSINLDRSYVSGEIITMDVFYHGVPASSGFGSFEFGGHSGRSWVWTLSEPYGARDWWPCKDHPSDKPDSVDIHVTCSREFKVASNGKLVGVVSHADQTNTFSWSERYPIATYLVFISLTNYAEFTNWWHYSATDSMQVLNYVLPENLAAGLEEFPKTLDMLTIFSQRFGLYPFIKEKFGHAEFGRGGAMEHQTMTSLVRGSFEEYVLAHELGHQWFGDLITCASWQELWLNEGFASYCEALYAEGKYGAPSYRARIEQSMDQARAGTGTLFKNDTTDLRQLFDQRTTYRKGASVLHMLRHVLGDSMFFRCLRSYCDDPRYRFKSATTRDFQGVCETVAGRSLEWFFRQWVFGERFPQYSFSWFSEPVAGDHRVTINLTQTTGTNNPSYFEMPIDFKFHASGWDTTLVLWNDAAAQQYKITLPRQPLSVVLDPENWILKDIIDPESIVPSHSALEQNFPNPFNASTTIVYRVARREAIRLDVLDMLGRTVDVIVDEIAFPGTYRVQWSGKSAASGVLFFRFSAGTATQTRKALLIR